MIGPDDVLAWIVSTTGSAPPALGAADTVLLERVVGAVVAQISKHYVAPVDDTEPDWEQAHLMAAARLWQRRRSTDGIAAVNDFGPLRVGKLDSDVELLLDPFRVIVFA